MSSKAPIAVVTQVFNEDLFLPIWLRHYGELAGYQNLIVIDDGSTTDSRIKHLVRKTRAPKDETDRAILMGHFHESLLQHYECVIVTDCDELIVLDPQAGCRFDEYLARMASQWSYLAGFNVLHDVAREAGIDLAKPLFQQRKFVKFDFNYCKPLISKVPIRWAAGFHKCNRKPTFHKDLLMFHLRSIDYSYSCRRINVLRSIEYSADSVARNESCHLRGPQDKYLAELFDEPNQGIPSHKTDELFSVFYSQLSNRTRPSPVVRVPSRFERSIEFSTRHTWPGGQVSTPKEDAREVGSPLATPAIQEMFDRALEKMIFSRQRSSDSLCPCGTGRTYGRCHGSLQRLPV